MEPAVAKNETPRQLRLSAAALLLANVVPLAGVLLFGWSISSVLILYWFENIVIGALNVVKLIMVSPTHDSLVAAIAAQARSTAVGHEGSVPSVHVFKLFMVPFFVFHYFFFCAGHGYFLFSMFGDQDGYFGDATGLGLVGALGRAITIFATPLALAAAILVASHAISFVQNYIGAGEYKQLDLRRLMMAPYGRVVALHVTIIAGGFATMALGQPLWALVVLVVVKTCVDFRMHLAEHRKVRS